MLLGVHVDKVDDDDPTHIAQPKLAYNFFRRKAVHLVGVFLLVVGLGPDAAVDVDDVEGLGRFDHEIGALLDRDDFSEGALDLARHFEVVEDRLLAVIEFDDLFLLGGDQ